MKIRMLSTAAGAIRTIYPGQILSVGVDITRETAVEWLNAGYAESVKEQIEQAIVEPKETANGASNSKRTRKRTSNNS